MQENTNCLIISILFSHFTPRDATLGNSLMHVLVRMTYEKTNGKFMMRLSCCLKWEKKTNMLKWSIHLKLFWKEKYDLRKRFQNKQTNKLVETDRAFACSVCGVRAPRRLADLPHVRHNNFAHSINRIIVFCRCRCTCRRPCANFPMKNAAITMIWLVEWRKRIYEHFNKLYKRQFLVCSPSSLQKQCCFFGIRVSGTFANIAFST